jgi:cellulose synthase/poly-beta-1,6-N-acetylglucosamine synthase-like glycosyltransferase
MVRAANGCDAVGGRLNRVIEHIAGTRSVVSGPDRLQTGELHFLPYATGANCGVHKRIYRELRGFDEGYFGGGDDVDFFWRLQLAGYRLCFVPDAVVEYRQRPDLPSLARQFFRFGMQDVHLYRAFARVGMPRHSLALVVKTWTAWFIRAVGASRSPHGRRALVEGAARRAGRVIGSARYRTVYL